MNLKPGFASGYGRSEILHIFSTPDGFTLLDTSHEQQGITMSESDLIAEVARVWVDGGGDAEGIDWCWQKIRNAVTYEVTERKTAEEDCES